VGWHRNPGLGPTWIDDEALAEQVKEQREAAQRSAFLGKEGMSSGWFFETAEEKERFLEELPGEAARARLGGR
jgi:hypothetical protein